jgi:predicted Zn-dependent peptidase
MKNIFKKAAAILFFTSLTAPAFSVELVTDKEIKALKNKTEIFNLSNGIPVIYRNEESSDIVHLAVSFDWALKDQNTGTKTLPNLVTALMTRGSKSYPQKKVFELVEKFSLSLGCAASIDRSSCHFETINEYFDKNIPLLTSSIKEPDFKEDDFKNIVNKSISSKRSEIEDPDNAVNQAVNKIYYEPNHPYVLPPLDAIKELEAYKISDLQKGHKELLNASKMSIAIVTSLPIDKVKTILEREFSGVSKKSYTKKKTNYPKSANTSLSIIERDIPTAYIKVKIPAPSINSNEAATSRLLFEILSEEMAVEIRTKRSLSYAAYAYTGQGQIGLGVFSISTPKPKESLNVLSNILKKIKSEKIDDEIFEEYKRTFSTGYFLSQETHSSMASMLLRSHYYTGGVDYIYELPKKLGEVKSDEVKELANKILKNFKVGILGKKSQVNSKLKNIL